MDRILSTTCTADQSSAMMKNSWRYARVKISHVRIHPPTSDVSVQPPGAVGYVATIELADNDAASWGKADADGVTAVTAVFGNILT